MIPTCRQLNIMLHHIHLSNLQLLVFIVLCSIALPLTADETSSNQEVIESKLPQSQSLESESTLKRSPFELEHIFNALDKPQQYLSSGVIGLTKRMDEFFSDEEALYETNDSYIRMTGDMVLIESENPGFVGDLKAKIELPNTQNKLKFIFESDTSDDREELERQLDENPVDAAQDKSFFAGIEGLLGEFKYWKFRPSLGVKLSSSLDTFVRFRANRPYEISEKWRAYFRNTLYWFDSSGYGFDSSLEFDHQINKHFLFRSTLSASRKEENEYWELNQIFSLSQSISKKQAMIYSAGVFGISEPIVIATDYLLQVRYRQQLHSDYLFMELIPKIQYQREDDFEPVFSLTFRVEIVFK